MLYDCPSCHWDWISRLTLEVSMLLERNVAQGNFPEWRPRGGLVPREWRDRAVSVEDISRRGCARSH